MKTCTKCKMIKPLVKFGIYIRNGQQRLKCRCGDCLAEDARLNRKVNFDKVKEIEKKYKVANKDKIAAKYKEY